MTDFLSTNQWLWVDYTIAGIVLFSAVAGLLRGFIKEVFALVSWMVAGWVATQYCHDFSQLLQNSIALPSARIGVAFAGLFVAALIAGALIGFILSQLVQKTGLTVSDRLVGMGFGLIRGAVLVAVLVMLAGFTPLTEHSWWKQSRLLPPFQSLAVWLKDRIPSNLAEYIKYR